MATTKTAAQDKKEAAALAMAEKVEKLAKVPAQDKKEAAALAMAEKVEKLAKVPAAVTQSAGLRNGMTPDQIVKQLEAGGFDFDTI